MPREVVVLVPGCLQTRTGGYEYDRRIVAGLRERGWPVDVRELDASFPHPTPAARDDAARQLATIPNGTTVLIDGLALGSLPAEVEREASRLKIVALVHMPLAAEIGLDRETAARFKASERRALAAAVLVVVTGRSTSGVALNLRSLARPDRAGRTGDRSGAAGARLDRRASAACCRLPRSQRERVTRFWFARWR